MNYSFQDFMLLNPNVKMTKGITQGVLTDLSIGTFYTVPISLIDFLEKNDRSIIINIYSRYTESEKNIISEYIEWLLLKNLILVLGNEELGQKVLPLSTNYFTPFLFTNCILEFNSNDITQSFKMIEIVLSHRIPFLEIRIFDKISLESLLTLIDLIQNSNTKNLLLILPFNPNYRISELKQVLKFKTVIGKMVIFNSPKDKNIFIHEELTSISFVTKNISKSSCGKFGSDYFFPNTNFFNEGSNHNTCLNRKLAIDKDGNIKNCPSFREIHGNIFFDKIEDLCSNNNFIKYWNIPKSKISICKDCEYRDICLDCRAYLQEPSDIFSKPLKCGYDPYTNKWEEWSINPFSKKGIEYYGMQLKSQN